MPKPTYTAHARVTGGRAAGHGVTTDGKLDVRLRHPKELGGDGDGTNPEQLFAVGYAACFATVLNLLGARQKLTIDPVVDSAVHLIPTAGGRFQLGVELEISLPGLENAADLVREAHQICPYSNATRGNIEVTFSVNGIAMTSAP
jgi:Ohr subfamily peroxiredoxin